METIDTVDRYAGERSWQEAIFGELLVADPDAELDRQALCAGLLRSDPAALGLVGRLLVWRASRPEQLPPQLKEIGEAFYRWSTESGRESAILRTAIISFLERTCADAGLGHRIELAHIGDRFDRLRHQSSEPGLELVEIHGWVVLRENGSVYTKAQVVAR